MRVPPSLPEVRPPKPLLPREVERRLTPRQRQILDALQALLLRGRLADLTMAEIAARANCSLRTLYEIGPSKDALVLTVVDRRLHRIGRAALEALDANMAPLKALRVYLGAVNEAVPNTVELGRVFADLPGADRLFDAHEAYVIAVIRSLLDRAVAAGEIGSVDTSAVAHVLGGLGREFCRPALLRASARSPKETADAISEILLRGLRATVE